MFVLSARLAGLVTEEMDAVIPTDPFANPLRFRGSSEKSCCFFGCWLRLKISRKCGCAEGSFGLKYGTLHDGAGDDGDGGVCEKESMSTSNFEGT